MLLTPSLIPGTLEDLTAAPNEEAYVQKLEKQLEAKLLEIQEWRKGTPVAGTQVQLAEVQDLQPDIEDEAAGAEQEGQGQAAQQEQEESTEEEGEDEDEEEEEGEEGEADEGELEEGSQLQYEGSVGEGEAAEGVDLQAGEGGDEDADFHTPPATR